MIKQAAVDDLLVLGTIDWFMLLDVYQAVKGFQVFNSEGEEMDATIEILDFLVSAGYVEIGDLGGRVDKGFQTWRMSKDDALAKVRADWEKLSEPINMNDVCWLNATSEGERLGKLIHHTWISNGNENPFEPGVWIANDRYGLDDGRI